jgi:predicted secreted Zn-dependent protease
MKRLILLVGAVALVAATTAMAARPPSPGRSAQNVAHMCKALRAANPTLFKATWGKNANKRNAYGKCVAAHARAKHHGCSFTLHNPSLSSSGTVTRAGAAGCELTAAGCALTSSGTIAGAFAGTYSSSFTIFWLQKTSNGAGGFCAPASGTTTLTIPGLGTLTKSEQGTVCEVGTSGPNVEHTMTNGTFSVTAGSGVFTAATGLGTSTFEQKPGATSALGGAVTDSETFSSLTIKL